MEIRRNEERMEDAARRECEIISAPSRCLHSSPGTGECRSRSLVTVVRISMRCPPPLMSADTRMYTDTVCEGLSTIKLSKGVSSSYSEQNMSYERKQGAFECDREYRPHISSRRHWG